jgi:hypothetical protein
MRVGVNANFFLRVHTIMSVSAFVRSAVCVFVASAPLLSGESAQAVTTLITKNIVNDTSNRPFFDPLDYDPLIITNDNDYFGTATSGADASTTVTGINIGIGGDGSNGVPMGVTVNFDVSFTVATTGANSVLVDNGNTATNDNQGLGVLTTGETGNPAAQISTNEQLLFDNFQVANVSFVDPLGLLQAGATVSNPKWFALQAPNFGGGDHARTSDDAAVANGVTIFNSTFPITNDLEDGVFPAAAPFYLTGFNGNWNLKGLAYQVDFTHELAGSPATRRTFQFVGGNLPPASATTHQLADGDVTISMDAIGAAGVFVTNNSSIGIGVDSTEDDATGGAAAQRGIDGTLATPEAIQFSFDKTVSLESLTIDGVQFVREDVVLSFVSGVNPFTGLSGYAGDYTLGADSMTVSATDVAARQPYPLMFGVGGQDEIIVEAGTVLSLTSALKTLDPPAVSDGGFLLDMITVNVVEDVDADFDGDDDVDGNDFLIWQRNVGDGTTQAEGDANGDDVVDGADLAAWEGAFGSATANAASVPEPATLALATFGMFIAVAVRVNQARGLYRR